jgi:hypothetical protein
MSARWWRARNIAAIVALATSVLVIATEQAASADGGSYRLPWDSSETWQVSRGPSIAGSHPSSTGFSAWDFYPLSLDEGIHTLAVGSGIATVFCEDGEQAHVELVTTQGDTFRYAHLDAGSVAAAGITTDGTAVQQGQSLGTLYHDVDGYSLPCGSGTGPHLHFEIETAALPVLIDGYLFTAESQMTDLQLDSSNTLCDGICNEGAASSGLLFYSSSGTYLHYGVSSSGRLTALVSTGDYSEGWDSITAIDLDGNGQDEIFFYREDGTFGYYNIRTDGSIGSLISSGTNYSRGWDSISPVDLDGDGQDEMFFYREDGTFRYYNIRTDGSIGSPINSGTDYSTGWDSITATGG